MYSSETVSLSDARLRAQAAFVARRLLSEGMLKGAAVADVRLVVEAALEADRERGRALDREVEAFLRANAEVIRGANVDYAEMFRKARQMLAAKKKIPL